MTVLIQPFCGRPRRGSETLLWPAALHVNKQAWSLQMSVAGEIKVVDLRTFEGGCLLSADVRRKHEDPVARLAGGQGRSASLQLFDDDPNVLVAEVSLLLDKVPNRSPCGPPCDDAVELNQSSSERANLGLRHPLLQSRPVHVEVGRGCWPSHVHSYSTSLLMNRS